MKVLLMILTTIIIVGGISGIDAFTPNISVTTDKTNYSGIEIMQVSGISIQTPVILKVTSPNGSLITIAQVETDESDKYHKDITVGGELYNTEGIYTVTTISQEFDDTTMIEYATSQASITDIEYVVSGAEVDIIYHDPEALSIIVGLSNAEDGEIILTLPRDVIDSTIDGVDDTFFVLVDGYEVEYSEVATEVDRTLTIPFSAESNSIEIIGTFVIPEFGTIAMMILVVAIISIIVVTKKARLVAI
jgi:predicted secreted protein with PEFG-CTERM motif